MISSVFFPARPVKTGVLLALMAAVLSGCAGFGRAIGGGKNPPDEFAVATKAPLVVPPDYSLRPPKPGETRPQELSASQRAQQVLLGDTGSAPPSQGEQVLLQKAGALGADGNIRNILAAENGGRGEKDRSLANQLMFWNFNGDEVDYSAAPLKVDDPEAWLAARREAIKSVTGGGQVVIKKDSKTLGLPGVF